MHESGAILKFGWYGDPVYTPPSTILESNIWPTVDSLLNVSALKKAQRGVTCDGQESDPDVENFRRDPERRSTFRRPCNEFMQDSDASGSDQDSTNKTVFRGSSDPVDMETGRQRVEASSSPFQRHSRTPQRVSNPFESCRTTRSAVV